MRKWVLLLVLGLFLLPGLRPLAAQEEGEQDGQVQALHGRIEPGEIILYKLPDLRQGQRLYVTMQTQSGNLDPIVGLVGGDVDPEALEADFEEALTRAVTQGEDPFTAVNRLRDEYFLAWDDDGSGGLAAAMEAVIPEDGDYRLMAAGSFSALGGNTFGDYELTVGLDAPLVLSGEAEPTHDGIAFLDTAVTPVNVGVEEITGTLSPENSETFVELNPVKAGDTFYAYIETVSGDLNPALLLTDFAQKPLRSSNLNGDTDKVTLEYTFPTAVEKYRLYITNCCGETLTSPSDYRLLVGLNDPVVLSGAADPGGKNVVREPEEVKIGFKLEQMIDMDQQREILSAVIGLRLEWHDPALAFNPETCQCNFKTLTKPEFDALLLEKDIIWPDFTILNQQGPRWAQNKIIVISSSGDVIYFERFTTDLQVDFDFAQFPFDTQSFIIHVDSIFPAEYYTFSNLEDFTQISPDNGEDEFILSDYETQVSNVTTSAGTYSSRYTFSFSAPRHLDYYMFRIFVPVLLIILVSWVTFFLKDYRHRIEIASANLLLFIAFSFSLADNYPRLGYMTFLDAIMAIMFVVNSLVIVYNVWLKRLEMNEEAEKADRIDSIMDWVYPVIYLALLTGLVWLYFYRI